MITAYLFLFLFTFSNKHSLQCRDVELQQICSDDHWFKPIGVFSVRFSNLKGSISFIRVELNCSSEYRPRHCVIMWNKRWFLKAFVASKYW